MGNCLGYGSDRINATNVITCIHHYPKTIETNIGFNDIVPKHNCGDADFAACYIPNFCYSKHQHIEKWDKHIKSEDQDGEWGKKIGGTTPTGDDLGWDVASSWSTGLTKEHFDGEVVGHQVTAPAAVARDNVVPQFASTASQEVDHLKQLEEENRKGKAFVDGWGEKMREMSVLMKQVREPGARGAYLKDSEKAEMYRLHKENPEVYTVEKLARDYRIMRQRVHAILWLKELEEEEEKKLGHPLDDSVELLLDTCPE
ncbi:hypothetical protein CsSME_00000330 [Camellia sinensis var. sinensis]